MAEKKSVGHAYNVDFLNVVFAASSIFLFLSVIWMVWDDFNRDWKTTQRRFAQLEYQVTQAQRQQAVNSVDKGKIAQLEAQKKAAEQLIAANRAKVDDLNKKLADADQTLYRATLDYNYMKATYDQDRYDFETSRVAEPNSSSTKKKQQTVEEEAKKLNELNLSMEKAIADKADVQKQLGQYSGQVADSQKKIDEMHAEQDRLAKRLAVLAPSPTKAYFRDAPLLDFMAPTLKVQQIILPNVVDDVNFIRVPKMDRCQTCHLAIDKKDSPSCGQPQRPACYSKFPQPFKNHPDLDVFLGRSSPHPIDR